MKNVLSIAGSDSSGGAGIQADLKTMCALGVYGMTVITAVTAQNTLSVDAVQEIDTEIVFAQIKAVFEDIPVDAVKIGMVSSASIIETVRASLLRYKARNIVADPVMVSKSGCRLLRSEAIDALRSLCAIADLVTPNIPEAELLCGFPVQTDDDMRRAAQHIAEGGAKSVLIKGGHRAGAAAADLLYHEGRFSVFTTERINTKNTHGTGCTLSSGIACRLALGDPVEEAVRSAKAYLTEALRLAEDLGHGAGPVAHLAALYGRGGYGVWGLGKEAPFDKATVF
ncbi:MAG: bifunctional hydroxymethylpyrimidine kinase/phosphomethylpyrimidine kinase [Spirochaetaceae bacterium]|nr:bifunctional hydroxymethylpyrimidine kinase/phosphomethylpyrimidine kinase [Spirochaetaceae bacterium]